MNTAGLLLFVLIGLFVVWLCHKADGDYIEADIRKAIKDNKDTQKCQEFSDNT